MVFDCVSLKIRQNKERSLCFGMTLPKLETLPRKIFQKEFFSLTTVSKIRNPVSHFFSFFELPEEHNNNSDFRQSARVLTISLDLLWTNSSLQTNLPRKEINMIEFSMKKYFVSSSKDSVNSTIQKIKEIL